MWLYHRFTLSQRYIEDQLTERGISVSYESIRLCCNKFGPRYAQRLKRRHQSFGDTYFIDEVFVKIRGKRPYLWRACKPISDQHQQVIVEVRHRLESLHGVDTSGLDDLTVLTHVILLKEIADNRDMDIDLALAEYSDKFVNIAALTGEMMAVSKGTRH